MKKPWGAKDHDTSEVLKKGAMLSEGIELGPVK